MVCYHKHRSLKIYRFLENVLVWLHNNWWFLWKSNNCSFKIVTSWVALVSNFIDIVILKSSLIIDILDVLCFLTLGLYEVKSSPNLLQINVIYVLIVLLNNFSNIL